MTSPDPATGRFSLWSVILIAAGVLTVSAGAGWTVGRSLLGDEIEQYRTSESWRAPQAIKEMKELAERLNVTLEERAQLESIRDHLKGAVSENESLKTDLEKASATLRALQEKVSAMEGEELTVPKGASRFVVPREIAVGVVDLNPYAHSCTVQVGERQLNAVPGTVIEERTSTGVVRLTLTKVNSNECTFAVVR